MVGGSELFCILKTGEKEKLGLGLIKRCIVSMDHCSRWGRWNHENPGTRMRVSAKFVPMMIAPMGLDKIDRTL